MHSKSFRCLWTGQLLANFGDVFYIVALITLMYQMTANVTFTAMVPFFLASAQLVSGIIAPLLLDRFPLRTILLYFQLAKTVLLLGLALFATHLLSGANVYVLFAFVFVISFLDGWMTPARNALVPRLVAPPKLIKINSLLATTDQTVEFAGWALGGILVAYFGGVSILWLTFLLYALATLFMIPIQEPADDVQEQAAPASKWDSIKEGWVTIWQTPALRTVTLMDFVEGIAGAVWMGAILLVYVKEVLHEGEKWWGFINASYLTGTVLGGLLVYALSKWVTHRLGLSMILGSMCFSLFALAFALTSHPWVSLFFVLLMGPVYQLRDIAQRTIFQQHVELKSLPKVFSAQGTFNFFIFLISVLVMGDVAERFGTQSAYLISAILTALSGLIAIINRRFLTGTETKKAPVR